MKRVLIVQLLIGFLKKKEDLLFRDTKLMM